MSERTPAAVLGNIKAEMGRRGIRQAVIAEALNVSVQQVSMRLLGRTPISISELHTIARVLDVDPASLISVPA